MKSYIFGFLSCFFHNDKKDGYCQNCGKNLTNKKSLLVNNFKIYCYYDLNKSLDNQCVNQGLNEVIAQGKVARTMYLSPEDLQSFIQHGTIKHYGLLEKITEPEFQKDL